MSWSERETFLRENVNIQAMVSSPAIVSGVGDIKTSNEFNSLLKKIKKDHPRSTIKTR